MYNRLVSNGDIIMGISYGDSERRGYKRSDFEKSKYVLVDTMIRDQDLLSRANSSIISFYLHPTNSKGNVEYYLKNHVSPQEAKKVASLLDYLKDMASGDTFDHVIEYDINQPSFVIEEVFKEVPKSNPKGPDPLEQTIFGDGSSYLTAQTIPITALQNLRTGTSAATTAGPPLLNPKQPSVITISGPSGVGKTTIVKRISKMTGAEFVPSVTTRPLRPKEKEGVDKFVVTKERFEQMIANGEFVEHRKLKNGHYYGRRYSDFKDISIIDMNLKGVGEYKRKFPNTFSIFLKPNVSAEVLASHMLKRGGMSESERKGRADIMKRMLESASKMDFDLVITSRVGEYEKVAEEIVPQLPQPNPKKYKGKASVVISRSTKKDKKLMAVFNFPDGRKKTTHFGGKGYSDYTIHNDKDRKKRYDTRHSSREDWDDFTTAGALSKWILWNKPSLMDSFNHYKAMFSLDGAITVQTSQAGKIPASRNPRTPWAVFIVGKVGDKYAATTRDDGRIGLPGGKVDAGESGKVAVMREATEEGWRFPKETNLTLIHQQDVEGNPIDWYMADTTPSKLSEYKEKHRGIKPILITEEELRNSGFGNENLPLHRKNPMAPGYQSYSWTTEDWRSIKVNNKGEIDYKEKCGAEGTQTPDGSPRLCLPAEVIRSLLRTESGKDVIRTQARKKARAKKGERVPWHPRIKKIWKRVKEQSPKDKENPPDFEFSRNKDKRKERWDFVTKSPARDLYRKAKQLADKEKVFFETQELALREPVVRNVPASIRDDFLDWYYNHTKKIMFWLGSKKSGDQIATLERRVILKPVPKSIVEFVNNYDTKHRSKKMAPKLGTITRYILDKGKLLPMRLYGLAYFGPNSPPKSSYPIMLDAGGGNVESESQFKGYYGIVKLLEAYYMETNGIEGYGLATSLQRAEYYRSFGWLMPLDMKYSPYVHKGPRNYLKLEDDGLGWDSDLHKLWRPVYSKAKKNPPIPTTLYHGTSSKVAEVYLKEGKNMYAPEHGKKRLANPEHYAALTPEQAMKYAIGQTRMDMNYLGKKKGATYHPVVLAIDTTGMNIIEDSQERNATFDWNEGREFIIFQDIPANKITIHSEDKGFSDFAWPKPNPGWRHGEQMEDDPFAEYFE
jgi:guanylate kinase